MQLGKERETHLNLNRHGSVPVPTPVANRQALDQGQVGDDQHGRFAPYHLGIAGIFRDFFMAYFAQFTSIYDKNQPFMYLKLLKYCIFP